MLVEQIFESSAPFSLFHLRCCNMSDLNQPILATAPQTTGQLTTDKSPKSVKISQNKLSYKLTYPIHFVTVIQNCRTLGERLSGRVTIIATIWMSRASIQPERPHVPDGKVRARGNLCPRLYEYWH